MDIKPVSLHIKWLLLFFPIPYLLLFIYFAIENNYLKMGVIIPVAILLVIISELWMVGLYFIYLGWNTLKYKVYPFDGMRYFKLPKKEFEANKAIFYGTGALMLGVFILMSSSFVLYFFTTLPILATEGSGLFRQ